MRFFVTEKISPRIGKTPEGFLVCYDVPITRTGELVYRSDEVPVDPGPDGLVHIERKSEDLFKAETLESFEGKPITVTHPEDLITPATWKSTTVGNLQNIRGTQGGLGDLMLADFLICDADAIHSVEAGEYREVSCGYDAEYEQIIPGRGYQRNIIGNHVALVSKGRAGARCSIQDSQSRTDTKDSKEARLMDIRENLRKLFPFLDSKTIDSIKDEDLKELEGEKEKTTDAEEISSLKSEIEGLKKTVDQIVESGKETKAALDAMRKTKDSEEEEARKKAEEEEKAKAAQDKKTKDQAPVVFKDAVSRAEIIKPGHQMPTFDEKTCDEQIKSLQCEVLSAAYQTEEGKRMIEPFTRGPVTDFASLDRATLDAAFTGVSVLMGKANDSRMRLAGATKDFGGTKTVADINKRNAEFWGGRK